jgi:TatD DNase family protein
VHPQESAGFGARGLSSLRDLARSEGAAAIGEAGLDYYRDLVPRARQREAFRAQVGLALELKLPLVVHIRDAVEDALAILAEAGGGVRAVLHAFSGGGPVAERAVAMGCFFGFGGPLTYPRSVDLRETFRSLPADRILLETDSPYLPPEGNRGARNEPALVLAVAQKAAGELGIEPGELAAVARRNANLIFTWE